MHFPNVTSFNPSVDISQLSGFTSDPRELCSCLYDLETNVCESFSILKLKLTKKMLVTSRCLVSTLNSPFIDLEDLLNVM